jgi:CheY-like chemotaxis protein
MTVILLADNNQEFLDIYSKFLSTAGYQVVTATDPEGARKVLSENRVDLAVLDIRLVDDDDVKDISGLEVAVDKAFRRVPKIILTGFVPSAENLRRALGQLIDEVPPAVAYVQKEEGVKRLQEVIATSLEIWPQVLLSTNKVARQIKEDYEAVRHQAGHQYNMARTVSVIGFLAIFAGIALAWFGRLDIGIVGTASGIVLQALSYLFFKRLDLSNERLDTYHRELLETYWLELLMSACDALPLDRQMAMTEQAITSATNRWLAPPLTQALKKRGREEKESAR